MPAPCAQILPTLASCFWFAQTSRNAMILLLRRPLGRFQSVPSKLFWDGLGGFGSKRTNQRQWTAEFGQVMVPVSQELGYLAVWVWLKKKPLVHHRSWSTFSFYPVFLGTWVPKVPGVFLFSKPGVFGTSGVKWAALWAAGLVIKSEVLDLALKKKDMERSELSRVRKWRTPVCGFHFCRMCS